MPKRISSWDLFAGLSVAGLLLPEAVAYASIAGLEPQHGIFAAIIGLLTYAIFGRSRFAIVAPTSSSAAILAAAAAAADSQLPPDVYWKAAAGAVLLTGVFFVWASIFRMGALAQFISRPVLRGFAFGLATTIILRQIPNLIGIHIERTDPVETLIAIGRHVRDANPASVGIGLSSLAVLILLKRWPRLPAAFVALCLGIAATRFFDLAGVALVGRIDVIPFMPGLPDLPRSAWQKLAEVALPLVLIIYAESWGAMRNLGLPHGETLNPNRELFALGIANIASGLFRGIPVGAGFSASSANQAAGAASRAAGVIAAISMAALIALFGEYVARIPEPVLAAVVISAVMHSLNPKPLIRLWRINRDQYVALAAALGVILFGVVDGMVIAVALSLIATLSRLANPRIEHLGRMRDSHAFVDLLAHPDALTDPAVLVLRPTAPLFFANAETVFGRIAGILREDDGVGAVIVSLEESSDLDSTAIEALNEFDANARKHGRLLLLARSKQHVRDALASAQSPLAAAGRSFWSVDEAFEAAQGELSARAGQSPKFQL